MTFWEHYLYTLKRSGWVLIPIWILSLASEQLHTDAVEQIILKNMTFVPIIWLYILSSLITTFVFNSIYFTAIALTENERLNTPNLLDKTKIFAQLIKESLRFWGHFILRCIFFIIPGLVFYIRMIFLPFVVGTNPNYAQGTADAIEESQRLSKGKFLSLFGIWIMSAIVSLIFVSFDTLRAIDQNPLSALFIFSIEACVGLAFTLWYLRKYQLCKI